MEKVTLSPFEDDNVFYLKYLMKLLDLVSTFNK